MKKFIARFTAGYPGIEENQRSSITWKQNSTTPDVVIAKRHITHFTAIYFFKMFSEEIDPDKIIVEIDKIEKFKKTYSRRNKIKNIFSLKKV